MEELKQKEAGRGQVQFVVQKRGAIAVLQKCVTVELSLHMMQ